MHAIDIKTAVTLSGVPAVLLQSISNILTCTEKTKTQSKAVDGCVRYHSRLGDSGLFGFLVHFQIRYIQALLKVWFRPISTEQGSIVHSSLSWSKLNWCNLGSIPDAPFQATSWIMPLSFFLCMVFHVSNHWHCFWPGYSTPMKAGRTRTGTE